MDLLSVEMISNSAMISLQFFLEIFRASFDSLSLCFIVSMLLAICCAVSFGLGVGKSFVTSNEFEFCFVSSKERKPPDKVESLSLNSIETKMIVVFAVIILMASLLGRMTDRHLILHGSQFVSTRNFHSSIRKINLCEKKRSHPNIDPNKASTMRMIVDASSAQN